MSSNCSANVPSGSSSRSRRVKRHASWSRRSSFRGFSGSKASSEEYYGRPSSNSCDASYAMLSRAHSTVSSGGRRSTKTTEIQCRPPPSIIRTQETQVQPAEKNAIVTEDLRKAFKSRKGPVEAVRGISVDVGAGEIFGLLGPNGAGKTTTLRMLTTLLSIDSGSARVAGFDV